MIFFPPPFRLSDNKKTSVQDEDDDVAAERLRIYEGGSKTDILQIRDLSKVKYLWFPPDHSEMSFYLFFKVDLGFVFIRPFIHIHTVKLNKMSNNKNFSHNTSEGYVQDTRITLTLDLQHPLQKCTMIQLALFPCLLCTDLCEQEEGSCGPDLCRCPCRRGKVTEFIYTQSYCSLSF